MGGRHFRDTLVSLGLSSSMDHIFNFLTHKVNPSGSNKTKTTNRQCIETRSIRFESPRSLKLNITLLL